MTIPLVTSRTILNEVWIILLEPFNFHYKSFQKLKKCWNKTIYYYYYYYYYPTPLHRGQTLKKYGIGDIFGVKQN